jgi:hypothetical protein
VFASIGQELDDNGAVRGCPLNNLTLELAFGDEDFRRELKGVFDAWHDVIARKLQDDMDRALVRKRDPHGLASYIIAVYSGAMAIAKVEQSSRPLVACLRELSAAISA